MNKEELIKYRDKLKEIIISKTKKNKKWIILTTISFILGILSICIPAMIVGDNNGQTKPIAFYIFVYLGIFILLFGVLTLIICLIKFLNIKKLKKYKDEISHELTSLVMKNKQESDKDFSYLGKINI